MLSAGALVYLNSFAGVFLFDDARNIVNRLHIRQLWPLSASLLDDQRPIVAVSLAVNYAIGGLEVWGYHLFNLAIHLLAGLALFGVVRRTLRRSPHSNRSPTSKEMGHPSNWSPTSKEMGHPSNRSPTSEEMGHPSAHALLPHSWGGLGAPRTLVCRIDRGVCLGDGQQAGDGHRAGSGVVI